MIRVRVLRDNIDRGDPNPILVEYMERDGTVRKAQATADFIIPAGYSTHIVFRPDAPLADGSRVWIEAVRTNAD